MDRARGIGDRAYAQRPFTATVLSEPPLRVPAWQRPVIRALGRLLARRFIRGYERQAGVTLPPAALRWHQSVAWLRALTQVAVWVHDGVADAHADHPWLMCEPAFARRLAAVTGVRVGTADRS